MEAQARDVLALYRSLLYVAGEEEGLDMATQRAMRRGFSREQIEATLKARGRLTWAQVLRCRVRYFSDGVALGSREFVDRIFATKRHRFAADRQSGARPASGRGWRTLYAAGSACAARGITRRRTDAGCQECRDPPDAKVARQPKVDVRSRATIFSLE
jgi:hypothetical protein